jgi:putative transposase
MERAMAYLKDLMIHSDSGSQYASQSLKRLLSSSHIAHNMSGKDDCWGNAVVESFFYTLKIETGIEDFLQKDDDEAWTIIYQYIDCTTTPYDYTLHCAIQTLCYKRLMQFEQQFR